MRGMEQDTPQARMQAARHTAGSAVGRPPWGYQILEQGPLKTLTPTDEGRRWVPIIFGWVISGWSLTQVAEMLAANHVRSGAEDGLWRERTLGRMIRTGTYSGSRSRKGREPLEVLPLVSPEVQGKAMAALAARAAPRAFKTPQSKPLLVGLRCGHPECPGHGSWPMYRWPSKVISYRCAGKTPQRKGCGNMIPLEILNERVLNRIPGLRGYPLERQQEILTRMDLKAWKTGETVHLKIGNDEYV